MPFCILHRCRDSSFSHKVCTFWFALYMCSHPRFTLLDCVLPVRHFAVHSDEHVPQLLNYVRTVFVTFAVVECFSNTDECGMQFVQDGVFKAELNEFFTRELAEDGYSGVEVRVTPTRTEIIILATRTQNVLGEKGRRIRELTSVVQKRFSFPEGTVELYAEKVGTRGLSAIAQAESLRYKLIGGLAVRRYVIVLYLRYCFC